MYSGSGGRDLSGNKRTTKQSMDQKLTAMNKLVHDSLSLCDKGTEEISISPTQSDIGDLNRSHPV